MNFNLRETAIYQAVKWEIGLAFRIIKLFKKLFLILFIILFIIFLYGFLTDNIRQSALSQLLGLTIITLTLYLGSWVKVLFLETKLKQPKLKIKIEEAIISPEKYNLAEFLSFEVAKAILKSKNNLTNLFYNLLQDNPQLSFIFSRALLSFKEIKKILKQYLEKILSKAAKAELQPEF